MKEYYKAQRHYDNMMPDENNIPETIPCPECCNDMYVNAKGYKTFYGVCEHCKHKYEFDYDDFFDLL